MGKWLSVRLRYLYYQIQRIIITQFYQHDVLIYMWIFVKASAHRAFNSNFWHFLPPLIQCNVLKKPNKRKCFLLFHVTNCHFLVNDITKILQSPFSQLQLIISPWNNICDFNLWITVFPVISALGAYLILKL